MNGPEVKMTHHIKDLVEVSFSGVVGVTASIAGILGLIQTIIGIGVSVATLVYIIFKIKSLRHEIKRRKNRGD